MQEKGEGIKPNLAAAILNKLKKDAADFAGLFSPKPSGRPTLEEQLKAAGMQPAHTSSEIQPISEEEIITSSYEKIGTFFEELKNQGKVKVADGIEMYQSYQSGWSVIYGATRPGEFGFYLTFIKGNYHLVINTTSEIGKRWSSGEKNANNVFHQEFEISPDRAVYSSYRSILPMPSTDSVRIEIGKNRKPKTEPRDRLLLVQKLDMALEKIKN